MSKLQIPESWASLTFEAAKEIGLVLDIQDGNHGEIHPKASDYKVSGIPFVMANNIYNGRLNLDEVKFISKKQAESLRIGFSKSGDVLLTHKGTIGQSAVVENIESEYVMLTPQVTYYRLNESGLIPKFISFYFQNPLYQAGLKSLSKQATRDYVGITKQATFSFPLPPLGEQKRIVEKIESTQEKVKTIESSISKAEELIEKYRESLLQKAFRGELVPQDPNDEPASKLIERIRNERAKQSDGKKKKKDDLPPIKPEEIPFEIPKSWEWVLSSDIFDIRDGTHDSPKSVNKGYPLVTSKNLKNGSIDFKNCSFISEVDHNEISKRSCVSKGDLLMAMIGTIGNPVLVKTKDRFSIKNVALFKAQAAVPNLEFLKLFIDSSFFANIIEEKKQGTTQKFLGLGSLRSFLFPLPPLNEQEKILDKVKLMSSNLGSFSEKLDYSKSLVLHLKSSFLRSAFTGRLVPQDLSEGTGQELLEKIKLSYEGSTVSDEAKSKNQAKSRKRRDK